MVKKILILIVLLLVFPAVTLLAQGDSVTVTVPQGASPDVIFEALFKLLYNATYLPFAAGMVTVLTALSKRLFDDISSSAQAFFWTVILWALWTAATELGYGAQFESLIDGLTTIGAAALGIPLSTLAAGRLYEAAKAGQVAVIGHSRSQPRPKLSGQRIQETAAATG